MFTDPWPDGPLLGWPRNRDTQPTLVAVRLLQRFPGLKADRLCLWLEATRLSIAHLWRGEQQSNSFFLNPTPLFLELSSKPMRLEFVSCTRAWGSSVRGGDTSGLLLPDGMELELRKVPPTHTFHLLKDRFYFPLLVLTGIYHCWVLLFFPVDLLSKWNRAP